MTKHTIIIAEAGVNHNGSLELAKQLVEKAVEAGVDSPDTFSNYWLNVVILKDKEAQINFLTETNDNGVMTRPIWELMN